MQILSVNGCQYRTKLMDRTRADRFARCLRANPHFDGVMLNESGRARNPVHRFFVSFHPRNPDALLALVNRVQSEQDDRAAAQWQNYRVVRAECGRWFHVENLESGETYETHPDGGCTCPHYEERLRPAALACKHSGIVRIHLALDLVRSWNEAAGVSQPEPESGLKDAAPMVCVRCEQPCDETNARLSAIGPVHHQCPPSEEDEDAASFTRPLAGWKIANAELWD